MDTKAFEPLDFAPGELEFVRPEKCDNSGPNCLEVAITPDGGRMLRSSREPHVSIVLTADEWTAHVDSVKAGQPY